MSVRTDIVRFCHPAEPGKQGKEDRASAMALYHFTAKSVSRGKGQSAVHTAAYNARGQLHDERENRDTKDYAYKGAVEFSGIFAPKNAPAWVHDREQLWNHVEAGEKRKDSQLARNVEFALPHELNAAQRRRLVTDFVRETFARRGMIADVNIHEPHDKNDIRNYHVHCLLTMRRLDGENFASKKETDWNKKAELADWREKWAHMGAKALERAGFEQEANRFRNGHKIMAEQMKAAVALGDREWAEHCDREAQIHKGAAVSAMEQRNDPRLVGNDIAEQYRAIEERNADRAEIRGLQKELATAQAEWEKQRQTFIANLWQRRDETKMEKTINAVHDRAAFQDGKPFRKMLYNEGILLARVDAAGIAVKDGEYERVYQNELIAGNKDAKLRTVQAPEGELVAVTKSGHVFRLNPNFVDRDGLAKAVESSGYAVPTLSESLQHFAEARQQQKADRHAAQHMKYETREEIRQQRNLVHGVKQTMKDLPRDFSGKDAGIKVVDTKGLVFSLGSFVESLLGMGAKPPPATPQQRHQQQRRALEALESIAESFERGDRLKADDVANLLPGQIDKIKSFGDRYMLTMIEQIEEGRKRDRNRSYGQERGI